MAWRSLFRHWLLQGTNGAEGQAWPVLQQVLQVLQPVLQAVLQSVVQGVEAATVLQPLSQVLTGVAQRAEVRLARQVATRPLKTRPPKRLPLSQQSVVSQH